MIFIDSNIFIFANIAEYPEHGLAVDRIKEATGADEQLGIDSIIVSEVSYKLSRLLGVKESYYGMSRLLSSRLVVYLPVNKHTVYGALDLSLKKGMKINDATIAQHALDTGSALMTDNLKDFKRIDGLDLLPLRKADR